MRKISNKFHHGAITIIIFPVIIAGVAFKSESMQKSTKIADSWQGSKNQNRSSFADW